MQSQTRGRIKAFFIILVILVILIGTNPSLGKHKVKIGGTITPDPNYSLKVYTTVYEDVNYHNFLFFSTTTKTGGGVMSFGILNTVINFN